MAVSLLTSLGSMPVAIQPVMPILPHMNVGTPIEQNVQNKKNNKIGLLGGSFNPPHAGHRDITLAAIDALGLDFAWWLVTPGNPLKEASIYAPYTERLEAARRLANDDRIVVSDFEKQNNLQYTAETLASLKRTFPDHHFVWLMGADSLRDFHKWRDWQKIAELIPVAVLNRPGYRQEALNSPAATALAPHRLAEQEARRLAQTPPPAWIYLTAPNNPLSSTELRKR